MATKSNPLNRSPLSSKERRDLLDILAHERLYCSLRRDIPDMRAAGCSWRGIRDYYARLGFVRSHQWFRAEFS